jgi:hypothetical protein
MFCGSYREALSEAALRDERLPAEVQVHLTVCASCREAFLEEKALFARIGAEVRVRVNAETPGSLLPRVQQEIAAAPATRTWRIPALAYVASGLAIGAIVLSFAVRTKVPSVKPESPAGHVSSLALKPSTAQEQSGSGQVFVAAGKKNRKPPQAVLEAEPEVLVSAEEQLGLLRYAASLRSTKAGAPTVVKGNAVAEIEPLQIASVDVKRLSIEPLEANDSN